MTRLIDADKLLTAYGIGIETAVKYPIGDGHGYDTMMLYEIKDMIDNAPTVDAVDVVRCKDCKNWKLVWDELHACICARGMLYTKANEYCSHGRKEKKCTKRR